MNLLFKLKIEIIQFFKKYYIEKRKKEVEREPELINELNKKLHTLNKKLQKQNSNKSKINRQINKIQNVRNGKIQAINVNRYILRFLLIILFFISLLNISLNLKGYNYFIYISTVIVIILSFSSLIITVIIKKSPFNAYYYNYDIKKIFFMILICLGTGYFLNSYKNELEILNKKSILIKNVNINSIDDLKNSTIEIINKDSRIKWKVDKNLKILTYEDSKKGIINIENTVIDDDNKVTLHFINEKGDPSWLKGKIIYFNWDDVKIRLKSKKTIEGEVYGKIIKLDNGETLILNNNFELRDENKKISDFGITGTKLKIKEIINNFIFIFSIIFISIEYNYYSFSDDEIQKMINEIILTEKNKNVLKKSVFSILKTAKLIMFPIALIQTFLMRNFIFNLLFDKNLKKGYDTISVVLSYFSKSYLLIFIILLLPIIAEIFKILKMIEHNIKKNSNNLIKPRKKRKHSRIKKWRPRLDSNQRPSD